ncbi:hypothetical protein ACLB2K_071484 [Fragaria x ananassa]
MAAEALVGSLLERAATITVDKVQGELNLATEVEEEVKSHTRNLKAIQAVLKDAESRQAGEAGERHWLQELNEVSDEMDNLLDEWSTHVLKQRIEGEIEKKEGLKYLDKKLHVFPVAGYLVELLNEKSSQDCEVPLIIPIVGMGGMGKTTLSQLAYNDEKVKTHFDKRIWVCVTDTFNEVKIARNVVECLDKSNTSKTSNSLQVLMECIHSLIRRKKFLLVLDDVWNPKHSHWEELIKPFRYGAMGSRIIVTTRNEEVATLMKATAHVIHLKQLSDEFCLSLFYYNAGAEKCSESRMFLDVGEKIVEKCHGLPLAAKTLGSMVREKKTLKEWENVLNSKLWEIEDIEQQIFRPLLVNYNDLAHEIRICLFYCAIFSKDYVYDKNNLVELWMLQNYLNGEGSEETKSPGLKYFGILVKRSFVLEVEVDESGKTNSKIHDIIHDFLLYMTKNYFLIVNDGQPFQRVNEKAIPKEIIGLIHLRYIDLSENRWLEELPDNMGDLRNLQTLRLVECVRLKKVELGGLINLKHLSVRGCENLKLRGIDGLMSLQTLDKYYVQDGDEGNKLEHLRNLNHLQGRLTVETVRGRKADAATEEEAADAEREEEEAAIMVKKAHLVHLVLNVEFGLG